MQPVREVSTFQWDTVFAVPVDQVNAAIIQQKSSPTAFDYSDPKGNAIKGAFDNWQIALNGDGKNINMYVPIRDVSGKIDGMGFSLTSADLIVTVNLEYVPADLQPASTDVTHMNLKVRATPTSPEIPAVSLLNTKWTAAPTGQAVTTLTQEVVEDVIPSLVISWLDANLIDFAHVFCTVELNKYIDKSKGWAWTKPTDIGYAYVDGPDLSRSLLGVLCMTGGRKRTVEQSDILDAGAIPDGSQSGFLVSAKRMLEELILPTLPLHWSEARTDDFEIVPGGDTKTGRYEWILQLKTGRSFGIGSASFQNGDGDTVEQTPVMKDFSISTDGLRLSMSAYTETEVGEGVTSWNKSIHDYHVTLGKNGKGAQTINYVSAGTPVTTHGSYESEGAKIFKWIMIALGAIATIVLGILTDGAAFVVGAIIIGCLTGLAADSPDIVKVVNSDASPSTDMLVFNTTNPITWANSKLFTLTDVALNGPLQLGGTLHLDQMG